MAAWPALLLAPSIALSNISVAYALVTPSCAGQDTSRLHWLAAGSTGVVLLLTCMAAFDWVRAMRTSDAAQAGDKVAASDAAKADRRRAFVALVATLAGALSLLVCVALWVPVWMLSPCT